MRLADGEGSSCPPILTVEMLETVRNLTYTKVACKTTTTRNAETEEIRRKQTEMEEEMRRKIMEYEEAMQVANERAQKFEQFMALQMNQDSGGGYG